MAGIVVVIGVGLALVLARFLGSLVYGVSPRDARTFAAAVVLFVVAALASLLPALRASGVDPILALRQDQRKIDPGDALRVSAVKRF